MVLEVGTNARKMLDYWDIESRQRFGIANTGLHQHFRRMDGARRQDHFLRSVEAWPARRESIPRRLPLPVRSITRDKVVPGSTLKVRPVHQRKRVGPENRLAPAVANAQVKV